MKIIDFKIRFKLLSKEQQETSILEMTKAIDTKDYLKGIKPKDIDRTIISFEALVQWCIDNLKQ